MRCTATLNLEELRELQRLLASIVTDCRLEIEESYWHIRTVDPAHIACLELHIDSAALGRQYSAEPCMVQLNVERLGQILKQAPRKGEMRMELANNVITWTADQMRWRQRLSNADTSAVNLPDPSFAAKCMVPREEIMRAGRMAADVSDAIHIELDGEALTLSASNTAEDAAMTIAAQRADGQAAVSIPLDYWQAAAKAIPEGMLGLSLGDYLPVQLSISTWAGMLSGRYLIAPRIEDEEVA